MRKGKNVRFSLSFASHLLILGWHTQGKVIGNYTAHKSEILKETSILTPAAVGAAAEMPKLLGGLAPRHQENGTIS